MNEIQKQLDKAFTLISAIPVSGDAVEIMAMAREHVRSAYKLAGKDGSEDGGQNDRRTDRGN